MFGKIARYTVARIRTAFASPAQRQRASDEAQAQFRRDTAELAKAVSIGDIAVGVFQAEMQRRIAAHLTQQVLLGTGGRVTPQQIAEIDKTAQREFAYLSRFGDSVAGGMATGKPLSEAQIANRAQDYSASGRAAFSKAGEDPEKMYRYVSLDDKGTCGPCLDAEGIYSGQGGPLPGEVCEGRGRCRCVREEV